ncbi:MAG: hrpB, partial [Proteobacteria bacterium]|nr:hrpB [Pseudomonadota bacterium]
GDRSPRAEAARKLADGWAKRANDLVRPSTGSGRADVGILLARVRLQHLAKKRDASGESWVSVGGRGYALDPASPLARAEWLAIGDAQGKAGQARITAAWPLTSAEVEAGLADRIATSSTPVWNEEAGRVEARLERRMGAITLASGPDPSPDPQAVAALLLAKAKQKLAGLLPAELIARAKHAGLAALAPERLADEAEDWLAPLLKVRRDLDLPKGKLAEALLGRLDWNERQKLDALAPREWVSPAGTHHAIDYAADGGPSVEVRVQALFGLDRHPTIGQPPLPLLLQLTSPGGRPVQATRDLPAFWRGSWRDVVRDMKGRYPKHRWPDEPWTEVPSLKTKNAFNASTGSA